MWRTFPPRVGKILLISVYISKTLGRLGELKRSKLNSADGTEGRYDSISSIHVKLRGTVVPVVARQGCHGGTVASVACLRCTVASMACLRCTVASAVQYSGQCSTVQWPVQYSTVASTVQWPVQYSTVAGTVPVPVTRYPQYPIPGTTTHYPSTTHPTTRTRYCALGHRSTGTRNGLALRMSVLPKRVTKRAWQITGLCIIGQAKHAWVNQCLVGFCQHGAKAC